MKLHTKSRDGVLYEAEAEYKDDKVIIKKGSKINRKEMPGFKAKGIVAIYRKNNSIFTEDDRLKEDVTFDSLSAAACFVTGRSANGNIVWKTENKKALKYSINK